MADASTTSDRVSFLVTDDELWIANTGRALTDGDVQGLCGLGASSKVDAAGNRRASIGHKGLGFKSVLEITDEPSVFSRTTSFTLGADNARPLVAEPVGRAVAAGAESRSGDAIPVARHRTRHRAGPSTRLTASTPRSASRSSDSLDGERRAAVADLLLGLPLTTVLFLKHLEAIDVRVEQDGRRDAAHMDRRSASASDEAANSWSEAHGFGGSGTYRVTVADGDADGATFLVAHDDEVAIGDRPSRPFRTGLGGRRPHRGLGRRARARARDDSRRSGGTSTCSCRRPRRARIRSWSTGRSRPISRASTFACLRGRRRLQRSPRPPRCASRRAPS